MNEHILKGMAQAFFATAYADQADECGQTLAGEIMAQLPPGIDPAALHAARTLYMDFERALQAAHGATDEDGESLTLSGSFIFCHGVENMSGATEAEKAENFGHYAAMQAMGHGVGLWEYVPHQVYDHVPRIEFGSYSLENDYFRAGETNE